MRKLSGPRTSIRKEMDPSKMRAAFAGPDADTRHWVSYATVAALGGTGGPDFTDPNAILITPAGVEVDLILEPSGTEVTGHHGISAGDGYICTPIRPGDRVQILISDGDLAGGVEILRVLPNNQLRDHLPLEDDGKPMFKNDRVLVHGRGVPVELRTSGKNIVRLDTDGSVQVGNADGVLRVDADGKVRLHGAGASESFVLGDTYLDALTKLVADGPPLGPDTGLLGAVTALAAAAVGPLAAFQPGFQTAVLALTAFNLKLSTFLSGVVKGE